jgi:hypothetical protein
MAHIHTLQSLTSSDSAVARPSALRYCNAETRSIHPQCRHTLDQSRPMPASASSSSAFMPRSGCVVGTRDSRLLRLAEHHPRAPDQPPLLRSCNKTREPRRQNSIRLKIASRQVPGTRASVDHLLFMAFRTIDPSDTRITLHYWSAAIAVTTVLSVTRKRPLVGKFDRAHEGIFVKCAWNWPVPMSISTTTS